MSFSCDLSDNFPCLLPVALNARADGRGAGDRVGAYRRVRSLFLKPKLRTYEVLPMSARTRIADLAAFAISSAVLSLLTGCGAGVLAGPSPTPGFKIKGNVHGGAWPIQGATIRLMETQSNGTWNIATHSYNGVAKQLLQTTSDSGGYFSFPDTGWACDAGQYAYITVTGGHTAAANNYNVVQVGVLGSCASSLATQSEIDSVNVYISELSTVAAAYALGNFITIDNTNASTGQQIVNITAPANNNSTKPGCTGSGSDGINPLTCVHAGLAHAFQNAYNLVDQVTYGAGQFPSGAARSTLPNNKQAFVPQAMLNTIGNIMQSCVDSGGAGASGSTYAPGGPNATRCGDLFYWATPPGQTIAPTNTLQVALNMAQYPTNNVDALFNLQPRAVFFTPDMVSDTLSSDNTKLMSYTVSIFYLGTGLPNDTGMPYPVDVALDENDNAYVAYSGGSSGTTYGAVNEFGPDGTGVFAGAHQSTITNPGSLALDANGIAWLANDSATNGNVYQIKTPGSGGTYGALGTTLAVPNGYAAGVATDMSNNVWTVRDSSLNQSLYRFNAGNSYAADLFSAPPVLGASAKRVLVDVKQNVLGVTTNTDPLGALLSKNASQVFLFPYASNGAATLLFKTTLNAQNGYGIAMSNSDVSYVPVYQELDTETGLFTGTMVSNGAGYYDSNSSTNSTYTTPMGVAMDGASGLFWSDFEAAGQIFWMQPSHAPSVLSGTLISFFPCYPLNGQCFSGSSSYLRGMAVDSSGALWYLGDSTSGAVIQTLGLGAPTYPLLSYAHGGVVVQ